jgi:hypothetical protein
VNEARHNDEIPVRVKHPTAKCIESPVDRLRMFRIVITDAAGKEVSISSDCKTKDGAWKSANRRLK